MRPVGQLNAGQVVRGRADAVSTSSNGVGSRARSGPLACLALAGALAMCCDGAAADTLEWALVQAYQNNPSLNAQRASLRSIDENVPQALSGYRPKLTVTANGGYDYANTLSHSVSQQVFPNTVSHTNFAEPFEQRGIGASATQTLFNGLQTANKVRQAESLVYGRARDLACDRAAGAARRFDVLHEFVARSGDPRSEPQQRRSVDRALAGTS